MQNPRVGDRGGPGRRKGLGGRGRGLGSFRSQGLGGDPEEKGTPPSPTQMAGPEGCQEGLGLQQPQPPSPTQLLTPPLSACVPPPWAVLPWLGAGWPALWGVWDLPSPGTHSSSSSSAASDTGLPWQPLYTLLTAIWDPSGDSLPSAGRVAWGSVPCQNGDGDTCL